MKRTRHSENPVLFIQTTLLQGSGTKTGIEIPANVVTSLGAGKKPPVRLTVNGYAYRSTIAVMDGRFMVGFSSEHRKASGIKGGDSISVIVELDTEPREAEVPDDLQWALKSNHTAAANFEKLSYSRKQAFLIPIKDAKTAETRQRRIEKTILQLSGK